MEDHDKLYATNHRRQQTMLAGGLALFALVGLLPRNERALFFTAELPLSALSAVVPAEDFSVTFLPIDGAQGVPPFLRARNDLTPGLVPAEFGNPMATGPNDVLAPAIDDGLLPFLPDSQVNRQLAALPTSGSPLRGGPGLPIVPASASPVGPPTRTPGDTVIDPGVGPVPEPAAWTMLIFGFFGIGTLIRRRRANDRLPTA